MVYNFKEYKPIFDTPMKKQQELAVARKIMNLLNKNKYDDLEEFISKNSTYQDFLKKNNMETVVKHFGNTLNEEDYNRILENILTKTKQDFEKENIKTTNIDNKVYNSFKGEEKTYFIDNSRGDKSIEEQLKDLQETQKDFQTSDIKQNTENMFKELENNKKESLNLNYLSEINYDSLTYLEKEYFRVALSYQQQITEAIRVDLQRGIIVDENDNIMKIEKENDEYIIVGDEDKSEKQATQEKAYQKQMALKPNQNTIYSS